MLNMPVACLQTDNFVSFVFPRIELVLFLAVSLIVAFISLLDRIFGYFLLVNGAVYLLLDVSKRCLWALE